jgi:hypothetical protein
MTLTPPQASRLRHQILRDLQNDSYVELDSRFVKPIFGGTADLNRWAKTWSLKINYFTRPNMLRSIGKQPIEWVSFEYNQPEVIFFV